jgi:transposase-like protein
MGRPRRNFSSAFKTKEVLEVLKENETISELSKRFDLHPNQISNSKKEF